MSDVEVHIDLQGQVRRLGLLRRQLSRRGDTVTFEYDAHWLECANKFSIEPALTLAAGTFVPQAGQSIFGSIGDSAPDTWGRRLMQRAERRLAQREGRRVRTLGELHYLLGVADESRLGALRSTLMRALARWNCWRKPRHISVWGCRRHALLSARWHR